MTNDTLNLQEARTKCDQLEKLIKMIPKTAVRAGFICDKMNCLMKENEEMKKKIIALNKMMRVTLEKNNAFQLITERDEANIKNFKLTKENEELKKENDKWKTSYMKHEESMEINLELIKDNLELIKDNKGLKELTQILETTDAEMSQMEIENEELTEELEMWKKYKHLDLSKLCPVDDTNFGCWEYWDFVVWEECLMKLDQITGEPLPKEKQDNPEYIKFCKYFPRPRDVDNEEEEEEETIEEPFCENGLCNGGQKFEIKDKMFCSPMCGNKYFNLEEDDSYYWH